MPKTRLAKWSREQILNHVRLGIQTPEEQKHHDRLMNSACAAILNAVRKRYPLEDMEVLQKYNKTRFETSGSVVTRSGQIIGFEIPYLKCANTEWFMRPIEGLELPLVPLGSWKLRQLKVSQKDAEKIEKWNLAKEELKKAKTKKLDDYKALILGSRYVEDIEDILPLDRKFLERFKKTTTGITVSNDVINRIKSDTLVFPKPALGNMAENPA